MILTATELTKSSFAKWGQYIGADDVTDQVTLSSAYYVGNIATFTIDGGISASVLEPKNREVVLNCMEAHKQTPELCVALENDSIIFVAWDSGGVPERESTRAYILRQGDSVVYNAGVWHWVPYPINSETGKLLIVYRNQTGKNDFYKVDLESPITAQAQA